MPRASTTKDLDHSCRPRPGSFLGIPPLHSPAQGRHPIYAAQPQEQLSSLLVYSLYTGDKGLDSRGEVCQDTGESSLISINAISLFVALISKEAI